MAYDRRPILTMAADKLAVRDYVRETVGEKYLTHLFQIVESGQEFNFSTLPDNFVLKPNHASGAAILVGNFSSEGSGEQKFSLRFLKKYYINSRRIDVDKLKTLVSFWLRTEYYNYSRLGFPEWAYKNIPRKAYAEELLIDSGQPPQDFRFFLFNGKCEAIMVDTPGYSGVMRDVYSTSWEKFSVRFGYPNSKIDRKKPNNLEEMIFVAEELGKIFDHVRVDLYSIGDRIVFGELTNYHAGGTQRFDPEKFDLDFGKSWLPDTLY